MVRPLWSWMPSSTCGAPTAKGSKLVFEIFRVPEKTQVNWGPEPVSVAQVAELGLAPLRSRDSNW